MASPFLCQGNSRGIDLKDLEDIVSATDITCTISVHDGLRLAMRIKPRSSGLESETVPIGLMGLNKLVGHYGE